MATSIDQQARADIQKLQSLIATLQNTDKTNAAAIAELQAKVDEIAATVDPLPPPPPPIPIPAPTGNVIAVRAGDDLQAALDQAQINLQGGSVDVRLAPGAKFTGNFVIRAANQPASNILTIRADAADGNFTPTGKPWIDASFASAMPKLESANTEPSLTCEYGAHGIRVFAVEALPNLAFPDRDLWLFGADAMTSLAQVPYNIEVDACYLHGDSVKGGHRGIAFHVRDGRIKRSYFEKFIEQGRDSQAWACWNGPGPITCESTYLEATGENIIVGGSDPKIPNLVPSDLTFRNCHFYKPLAWKTQFPGSAKNLFELKNARRVLIDGCLFENSWIDAQAGLGIVLTGRSQDGLAPWSTVQDVTIQYSVIKNVEQAVQVLGLDYRFPSVQGANLKLLNVLGVACKSGMSSESGCRPTVLQHITFSGIVNWFLQLTGNAIPSGQFTFRDSILPTGLYAITGDGTTSIGQPSLDKLAPGALFDHNVIEQQNSYTIGFPAGNTMLGSGGLAARLDARKRYTGPELASDGKKVGADVDAMIARMPWATW